MLTAATASNTGSVNVNNRVEKKTGFVVNDLEATNSPQDYSDEGSDDLDTNTANSRSPNNRDVPASMKILSSAGRNHQHPFSTSKQASGRADDLTKSGDQWDLVKVRVGFDVTRKGERSLVINGYKFTKSRDGMSDRVFWRCSRRECKATAVTVSDRVEHVRTLHTHKPPVPGEFFVDAATDSQLQMVRFNHSPSTTKPRARRRTSSQQQQQPSSGTPSNTSSVVPSLVTTSEEVKPLPPTKLGTAVVTEATPTTASIVVKEAALVSTAVTTKSLTGVETSEPTCSDCEVANNSLQAQAVAAILSNLMERHAAYRNAGGNFTPAKEFEEARDSCPGNQMIQCTRASALSLFNDHSGPGAAFASVPEANKPGGLTISGGINAQERPQPSTCSPSFYSTAYDALCSLAPVQNYSGLVVNAQTKRDSQNSTPDPPFEAPANSPPPPLSVGCHSTPSVVPISPPLIFDDQRHHVEALPSSTSAHATSNIRLINPRGEHPLAEASVHFDHPIREVQLEDGSTVGLLGKTAFGQLVLLSKDQLNGLDNSASHRGYISAQHATVPNIASLPESRAAVSYLQDTDSITTDRCERLRSRAFSGDLRPHESNVVRLGPILPSNPVSLRPMFAQCSINPSTNYRSPVVHQSAGLQAYPNRTTDMRQSPSQVNVGSGSNCAAGGWNPGVPAGTVLHWKKEKMRESEASEEFPKRQTLDSRRGRRRHFTALSQQETSALPTVRKRCASDCHTQLAVGVNGTKPTFSCSNNENHLDMPIQDRHRFAFEDLVGDWCAQVQEDILTKVLNTVQQLTAKLDADADPPEVIQNCKAIQACLDTIHALKRTRYEPNSSNFQRSSVCPAISGQTDSSHTRLLKSNGDLFEPVSDSLGSNSP